MSFCYIYVGMKNLIYRESDEEPMESNTTLQQSAIPKTPKRIETQPVSPPSFIRTPASPTPLIGPVLPPG